MPNIMNN